MMVFGGKTQKAVHCGETWMGDPATWYWSGQHMFKPETQP